MASPYSIGEQQTLFDLPEPLDRSSGRVWAGPVYISNRFSRRALPEIVIAVDGESISLYNVRNRLTFHKNLTKRNQVKTPSLTTSYALPPQTYLTAPPYSLRKKSTANYSSGRYTYLATCNGPDMLDYRITCFHESTADAVPKSPSTPSSLPDETSFSLGSAEDPVTAIQHVFAPDKTSNAEATDFEILLVQKSGRVTSVSPELSQEQWSGDLCNLKNDLPTNMSVAPTCLKYVAVCSGADASQGFLKGHTELQQVLADDTESTSRSAFLLCVTEDHTSNDNEAIAVTFRVFGTQKKKLPPGRHPPCKQLAHWILPQQPLKDGLPPMKNSSKYAFNLDSGLLMRTTTTSLVIYDLSLSAPRLLSQVSTAPSQNTSSITISGKLFMVSNLSGCALFDAYHQAFYATSKSCVTPQQVSGLKRKRSHGDNEFNNLEFIHYLPRLKMVLALCGNKAVYYQVSLGGGKSRRTGGEVGNVIDAFGCGSTAFKRVQSSKSTFYKKRKLSPSLRPMEKAGASGDVGTFENAFFSVLKSTKKGAEGTPDDLVDLALSQIFAHNNRPPPLKKSFRSFNPVIKMNFVPFRVLDWLIKTGHLSSRTVKRALRMPPSMVHGSIPIQDQDVVDAVAISDPSSKLLLALVQNASSTSLHALVYATKILLHSFDSSNILPRDRLLIQADSQPQNAGGDEVMLQNVADRELDMAAVLLKDGVKTRAMALKVCLHKVAICFSSSEISEALRMVMDSRDIVLLVELIRFELTGGGWTSRILDFYPDTDAVQGSDEAIAAMCRLLNCATDALGASGWLLDAQASGLANETAQMVSCLQDETTDVLEGVQESIFLKGFLKDFVRFGKLQNASGRARKAGKGSNRPIIQSAVGSMLPLGSKATPKVSATRIGAGGEIQKRSARDIAHRLNRCIGSYTHEKIQV